MTRITISIHRITPLFCLMLAVFLCPLAKARWQEGFIDPSFKLLLELYPRNKPIVNPMVPRLNAKLAFNLYLERKAIFFYAGTDAGQAIPGAIMVNTESAIPIDILNRNQHKYRIIYCH
jgi:hypothetical protein